MNGPQRSIGRARPRIGLLGNPSDGYGGRVLAFTFEDFAAQVELVAAPRFRLGGRRGLEARRIEDLCDVLPQITGGDALMVAALRRFPLPAEPPSPFEIRWRTTIPRQVGFSGSSALVVALLRAVSQWCGVTLAPLELARRALEAETEELGIAAGPQDRVVQSHEGFLEMNFADPVAGVTVTRLDPALLPPLFIAWNPAPGASSGDVHQDVRARFERGDPQIVAAMSQFAALAAAGRDALSRGDRARLRRLIDENFDLRARFWTLSGDDHRLIALGRQRGAAVKFAGSGGGVVGAVGDREELRDLRAAYEVEGYSFLCPTFSRPARPD